MQTQPEPPKQPQTSNSAVWVDITVMAFAAAVTMQLAPGAVTVLLAGGVGLGLSKLVRWVMNDTMKDQTTGPLELQTNQGATPPALPLGARVPAVLSASAPVASHADRTKWSAGLEASLVGYELLAKELEAGVRNEALWLKVMSENGADETLAKAAYNRDRAVMLQSSYEAELMRTAQEDEARRREEETHRLQGEKLASERRASQQVAADGLMMQCLNYKLNVYFKPSREQLEEKKASIEKLRADLDADDLSTTERLGHASEIVEDLLSQHERHTAVLAGLDPALKARRVQEVKKGLKLLERGRFDDIKYSPYDNLVLFRQTLPRVALVVMLLAALIGGFLFFSNERSPERLEKSPANIAKVRRQFSSSQSFPEALKALQSLADLGDAEAQYTLGERYRLGVGVEQSQVEAARYLRMAAELGHVEAQMVLAAVLDIEDAKEAATWQSKAAAQGHATGQFNLGTCYHDGYGVDPDFKEAVRWYRLAADQGNAPAQHCLGWMYDKGEGVTQDQAEALQWYRKAAEQGLGRAEWMLAQKYETGLEKNPVEAAKWAERAKVSGFSELALRDNGSRSEAVLKFGEKGDPLGMSYRDPSFDHSWSGEVNGFWWGRQAGWYRKAADEGDPQAQFAFGEMHQYGDGVAQDSKEAARLYLLAANQNHLKAQNKIWKMYNRGEGVAKDSSESARWLQKAAEQGDVDSQSTLGLRNDVEHNYTEAIKWYRMAADQGDISALHRLWVAYSKGEGVEKDPVEAVRWIRKAADQGDRDFQFMLGWAYSMGEGVEKDPVEVVRWYRKAADQGHSYAQNSLGQMYEGGEGVAKDPVEAFRWYRMAAENGYETAQITLGEKYINGEGVAKDLAEAARWYRQAADLGNALAQRNLGWMYYHGEGVAKDPVEAARWYKLAADQGDAQAKEILKGMEQAAAPPVVEPIQTVATIYAAGLAASKAKNYTEAFEKFQLAAAYGYSPAQTQLGGMYYRGEGVAKDYKEAVRLFRLAADQGDAVAQSYLGLMYQKGEEVAKDAKAAVGWYRQAADLGNAWAQRNLGWMYYHGEGVAKDAKEAVQWYRLAADQGDAVAQRNLGWMYYRGEGVAKDYKEAVRLFRLAADQGDAVAQNNLGWMYDRGEGVAKDAKEAVRWYRLAADQGDASAQRNLGVMYYRGEGVAKDYKEAVRWYRLAADQGDVWAQWNLGACYCYGNGISKNVLFGYVGDHSKCTT